MLILETPTKMRLEGYDHRKDDLRKLLTFTDKSVEFQIQKFRKNQWLREKLGDTEFFRQLAELNKAKTRCLLFEDSTGLYTYSGLRPLLQKEYGDNCIRKYNLPEPQLIPWDHSPKYNLRYYQTDSVKELLAASELGPAAVEIGCHARGDKILMYDGSIKNVECVSVGDLLMGPDSAPRKVEELKKGVDSIYKIETVNGQTMNVNGNHILSLVRTKNRNRTDLALKLRRKDYKGDNPILNITVNDYLKTSDKFKHVYKLYMPDSVTFYNDKRLPIDPYRLGLLLGDGSFVKRVCFTTMDLILHNEILELAKDFNLKIRIEQKKNNKAWSINLTTGKEGGRPKSRNQLINTLRELQLFNTNSSNKFIPHIYKTASKQDRLAILAGLIDTDGSYSGHGFDFITKSKQLADDVCFISRSLGFRATLLKCKKKCQTGAIGDYFRISISGFIENIPTKLDRKMANQRQQKKSPHRFGFKVTKISDSDEYFGFVLDKDHLYLTDSFLVTHNTGLGKSAIIRQLIKSLGLKTLVMAPSVNIAGQLRDDLIRHFGRSKVGFYGDGKKEFKKLITVGIAASLTRIEEDSEAFEEFSKCDLFIVDESHLAPAATLAKVCFGLMANSPYRFLLSGTQMRNDGLDLLLEAITGPIVYTMTVQQGVDQGFLAKPNFRMCWQNSNVLDKKGNLYNHSDVNKMTKEHVFKNPEIIKSAAEIANKSVALMSRPVVILVDELEQFGKLIPLLRYEAKFAHGGVTKENKKFIPEEYHKSDPAQLVEDFNNLKFPILVGTSCIGIGTDIIAVKTIINLRGGKSEVEISQNVGRGTRMAPGKEDFLYVDFGIKNVEVLEKHAKTRIKILRGIYPNLSEVQL